MQKKILITGGAGFVGSSLAIGIKKKYPQYSITCLDNLKRRGSELNLPRLDSLGIQFIHGDIRNREDLYSVENELTTIIEASAEPSVLAGINNSPDYIINTNLLGTVNCLHLAAKVKADFIFVSTSRIYPVEANDQILFTEQDTRFVLSEQQEVKGVSGNGISEDFPIDGSRSFYGATKLCSEFLISEFNKFYSLPTVINRCGVITGPWQMGKTDQGVIVHWVAQHYWNKALSYFGYGGQGKQVRDILHVGDLFELIDFQLHHMDKVNGRVFNVGGGKEISVSLSELTAICEKITGNKIPITKVQEERQADIRIYISDNSRIKAATGWVPVTGVEETIRDIYQWIKTNELLLKPILTR